jgi:multidrug efflux system outer membrane protein
MTKLAWTLAALALASCTVGPEYQRPQVDLPAEYAVAQAATPAPEKWWAVFQDPVLDKMIDEALANNRDLKMAAERIEQSRAQVMVARSGLWPDAGVRYDGSRSRSSEKTSFPPPSDAIEASSQRLVLTAQWELDFWGKFRRASEAARAELAATEAGRDAIRNSLLGDVARNYFTLLALDRRQQALELTREGRAKSLELQKLRLDAGIVSELEYRQVESDLRSAIAFVPQVRQQRVILEGALAVLLGRSPRDIMGGTIERGTPADPATVEVPAGLPSDLLLRRPDIRQAEEQLHAANARIGVARAALFPSITLTGYYGGESTSLSDLFSAPARTWSLGAGILQPLFAGGQIRGGIQFSEARTRELAEAYQRTIANAFREVREALHAQTNLREADVAQRERVQALERTVELTKLRYDNGAVSLFEYLESDRQLLNARIDALDAERARQSAIVDLYLALGA